MNPRSQMPPAPPLEAALLPARDVFVLVSLVGLHSSLHHDDNGTDSSRATGSNVPRSDLGSADQKVLGRMSTDRGGSPERRVSGGYRLGLTGTLRRPSGAVSGRSTLLSGLFRRRTPVSEDLCL